MLFRVTVLVLVSYCFAQQNTKKDSRAYIGVFSTSDACIKTCAGSRDSGCVERQDSTGNTLDYECQCKSNYYKAVEEGACETECDNRDWSFFTYGTCTTIGEDGAANNVCTLTCGWRVRVWTTVFIIVLFLMALAVLLGILPILICTAIASKKMNKNKKNQKLHEAYRKGKLDTVKVPPPSNRDSAIYATIPRSTSPTDSHTPIVSHPYDPNTAYWAHYFNSNSTLRGQPKPVEDKKKPTADE